MSTKPASGPCNSEIEQSEIVTNQLGRDQSISVSRAQVVVEILARRPGQGFHLRHRAGPFRRGTAHHRRGIEPAGRPEICPSAPDGRDARRGGSTWSKRRWTRTAPSGSRSGIGTDKPGGPWPPRRRRGPSQTINQPTNMPHREFEITIARDGSVEVHVKGYKGKSCLEAMKIFERVVGEMKAQRETSEFYEPDEQVQFNIEQRH